MCLPALPLPLSGWASTAEHSGRRVTTFEQHVHSFLESLPIMAGSALGCLHWREVRQLTRGARSRDAWRLRWKKNRLPGGYLAAVGAAVGAAIVVPYGEELYRCLAPRDAAARAGGPDHNGEPRRLGDRLMDGG
ncbi:hypothetical protein MUNTM_37420 [Mycobacterium sp. MUNTM1]